MIIRPLRTWDYLPCLESMRLFTRNRTSDSEDEIWLVEHPSVFTQGLAGLPEHVMAAGEIPVVATERGGQVTYHGPGQVLAYLLLDLRRNGLMVRALVDTMESAVIATLAGYGLPAMRKPGAPGVYMAIEHGAAPPGEVAAPGQTAAPLAGAKISALGIKVARGCSYHGLALNVAMDLEPFSRINPCGYPGLEVTDMLAELERQPGSARPHRGPAASLVASVASQLAEELALRLQR